MCVCVRERSLLTLLFFIRKREKSLLVSWFKNRGDSIIFSFSNFLDKSDLGSNAEGEYLKKRNKKMAFSVETKMLRKKDIFANFL